MPKHFPCVFLPYPKIKQAVYMSRANLKYYLFILLLPNNRKSRLHRTPK